jgi:hypothetical protein
VRLGNYTFLNDTHISVVNEKTNMKQILKHEYIHKETVGMSTYGLLLMMMENASIIDNRKKWLFNELLELFNKMQEQTATFIEYFEIIRTDGIEEFYRKIQELKSNNKPYYKYFNFIYQYLKEEQLIEESAEEIIDQVKNISILSSNIEIDNMPFEEWHDKKDMQRFLSKNDTLEFNPNKRFEILIKSALDGSSIYEKQAEKIINNEYSPEEIKSICIGAITRIYSDSKSLNIIKERISKFTLKEYDYVIAEHLSALTAFPIMYNVDLDFSQKEANGNINVVLNELKENKNSIMHFSHLLAGLEKLSLLSCIYEEDSALKVTTCEYNLNQIISNIKKVNNSIVFSQSKLYTRYKDRLQQQLNDRQMYIFMEQSFLSSYEFLSSEFASLKYVVIPQEEYDIVAIRKMNFTLIQLVVKGVGNDVRGALNNINIHPANILETMSTCNKEVESISNIMFKLYNVSVKNKIFGFK